MRREAVRPPGARTDEAARPAGSRARPGARVGRGPTSPMSRTRRAAALVAVMAVAGGCKPVDDLMVVMFGRSMRSSVSFDPYENPHQPAPNAVPFASGNYPSGPGVVNLGEPEGLEEDVPPLTLGDMPPPGSDRVNALENPVPADSASLARGQVMYERMCGVCHGVDGYSGQSAMVQEIAIMQQMMPAFNLADGASVGHSDGYLYGMIRMGRGLMPPYGHRITHFDRWHIVNYVRELQRRAAQLVPPGAGAVPDTAGAAGAGAPGGADGTGGGEGS